MASSTGIDATKASTISSKTASNGGEFQLSNKIIPTLDPCVVKTKEWISTYSHLWEENEGIYSLAQGVVYWKPPPSCRTALRRAVTNMGDDDSDDPLALHSYSPARGLPELIQALEEKIRVEHSMSNHDVTVTVGANQAYTNIVLTLLGNSNDSSQNNNKAVVFCPYYFNHVMAIQMCSGPEALLVGPTDMTTGLPSVQWLKETLEQHKNDSGSNDIRMVTLVNPGNPTGVALPFEKVKEIVDICKTYGVWVVLDCTYEHFSNTAPSNNNDKNPLPTFPNDPHVIHVFSFSKGYAMAGYRCGYLVSHKEDPSGGHFLSQLLKVQDTIPIGPPRLSQHVALGALKQGASKEQTLYSPTSKQWVYEKYATLDASRQYILEALSPLPQRIGGSGSMYVMGKLPEQLELGNDDGNNSDDDEPKDVLFCRLLVKDYGIATIPGSFCGFPGWIRICYANLPPQQTKLAAQRLQKGIRELTGQTV